MFARGSPDDDTFTVICWAIAIIGVAFYFRRRPPRTEFGYQQWATDKLLKSWGMLGKRGLILGRTLGGAMIRLLRYTHLLLIGGTGSGKGIGIIIPNLLTYHRGSVIVFDTKGDLYKTTAKHREDIGQKVYRYAPFNGGSTRINPLTTIPIDNLLMDRARALAEALVVREPGERDPHWSNKSVDVIASILILILVQLKDGERSLNSLQSIISSGKMVSVAIDELRDMGGIPANMAGQLGMLFEKAGLLTKEGFSVFSSVSRHLSFLNSEPVAKSLEATDFDLSEIFGSPGATIYVQIPPDQLEAQRGLLRCIISTFIRLIGSEGEEESGEILLLLDEASALGGLAAVKEALVRGRSAGCRILLAYQSDAQVRAAFPQEPTLIHDNCGVKLQMGPADSYEHADVLSKSLGEWTQEVRSSGKTWSWSPGEGGGPGKYSSGGSTNDAPQAHPLLRPAEILRLSEQHIIATVRGFPCPILARRIEWFRDPYFSGVPVREGWGRRKVVIVVWAVVMLVLILCALSR